MGMDKPTCQLLPIMSNKCCSGTEKEGKTKEVVKDREVKTVVCDKVVCERLCVTKKDGVWKDGMYVCLYVCMYVNMYVCMYRKVEQRTCWPQARRIAFLLVEAAARAWWRRKGTWPHERSNGNKQKCKEYRQDFVDVRNMPAIVKMSLPGSKWATTAHARWNRYPAEQNKTADVTSARPATQSDGRCHQVPRLPRQQPRRQRRPTETQERHQSQSSA